MGQNYFLREEQYLDSKNPKGQYQKIFSFFLRIFRRIHSTTYGFEPLWPHPYGHALMATPLWPRPCRHTLMATPLWPHPYGHALSPHTQYHAPGPSLYPQNLPHAPAPFSPPPQTQTLLINKITSLKRFLYKKHLLSDVTTEAVLAKANASYKQIVL